MFDIMTAHGVRFRGARWLATAAFLALTIGPLYAQPSTPVTAPSATDTQLLDDFELDELVGRIALYPDALLAIVLPASTYPLQIVQAARFLEELDSDPQLQPNPDWDDAVVALLNYPEVLAMMNEDLDWTWALGEAVLAQQDDVFDAVQDFRDRAYAAGNLRSDDRQVVTRNDEVIVVTPVADDVIYVPYYEPRRVIVYQPAPVIWYYPRAYPIYYYPYPVGYAFPRRHFWGVTTYFSIGWHTRYVHVHHHHYVGHPFHGRRYHAPYYVRRPITFTNVNIRIDNSRGDVWRPGHRGGARPYRSRPYDYGQRDYAQRSNYGQRSVTRETDRRTAVRDTGNRDASRPNRSGPALRTDGGLQEFGSAGRPRPQESSRATPSSRGTPSRSGVAPPRTSHSTATGTRSQAWLPRPRPEPSVSAPTRSAPTRSEPTRSGAPASSGQAAAVQPRIVRPTGSPPSRASTAPRVANPPSRSIAPQRSAPAARATSPSPVRAGSVDRSGRTAAAGSRNQVPRATASRSASPPSHASTRSAPRTIPDRAGSSRGAVSTARGAPRSR